jgi:branched-chain amino acid transport system permease protein
MGVYALPALDGVAQGLLLFTLAAGLSLAFGVADVLNLSHGVLYATGAYLAAAAHDTTLTALAATLLAGTVLGAAAGGVLAAATAPLAGRGHLPQVMLTLGVALIGTDLLTQIFGGDDLPVTPPTLLDRSVRLPGQLTYPVYRLTFIALAIGLAAALHLVVYRTRAGALVRAAVDDRQMLACLGHTPLVVTTGVLAGAGVLAVTAGVLGAPIIGPGPSTATTVMMACLVIVVLGGRRSIRGTLLAALTVGQVQTLGVALLPQAAPVLLFAVMALVLAGRARWQTRTTMGGQAT